MLKIKLSRTGAKNLPKFRVVVLPDRSKLTGTHLDLLGYFLPLEKKFSLDQVKYAAWVKKGARPTPKVASLVRSFFRK